MRRLHLILVLTACSASDDIPAPLISAVQPDSATAGSVVVVNGSYFCQRPDTGQEDPICDTPGEVQFGDSPATVTSYSDTTIMVEVPQGLIGAVSLDVVANGRESNSVTFTGETP
jgi:IPT/TIG domain-containing protein